MPRNIEETFDQTWLRTLQELLDQGERVAPRGQETRERLAGRCEIDMRYPVLTVKERRLGYRFMLAEAAWILSGDNRVATIKPFSKQIAAFSDDGYTFAGAYGPPLRDQLPWVVAQLANDQSTRQAVATVWRPRPGPSKDIPCTVALQWLLREDTASLRLHCVATMRSSDLWLGLPYDVFNFSCFSAWVAAALGRCLPGLVPRLGNLYLTAGSQHLYARDWDAARACLAAPRQAALTLTKPLDPLVWSDDPDRLFAELRHVALEPRTVRDRGYSPWLQELRAALFNHRETADARA